VLVGAAFALVAAFTPLRSAEVFALLVAPPDRLFALALLVVGAGSLVAWWRDRRAGRRWLPLGGAALLLCVLFVGRVVVQGVANDVPTESTPALRVLSWNAQGVHPAEIAERADAVIRQRTVDVLVLPEGMGEWVSNNLDVLAWEHELFEVDGVSVLIRADLAHDAGYEATPGGPPWAGMALTPRLPAAATPVIVAAHVQQPSPGNVAIRNEHVEWVRSVCDGRDYVLAVGDFNSTANHLDGGRIGRCADVASAVGAGATATWPTWLPPWAGISIDRAMVSPPYAADRFGVHVLYDIDTSGGDGWGTGRGADHWPILVEVPPAETP
jgi:endonuclease/exonuclease/phosphatase family metal-dependent hydrolase